MLVWFVAETIPQIWFENRRYLATGISRAAMVAGFLLWPQVLSAATGGNSSRLHLQCFLAFIVQICFLQQIFFRTLHMEGFSLDSGRIITAHNGCRQILKRTSAHPEKAQHSYSPFLVFLLEDSRCDLRLESKSSSRLI